MPALVLQEERNEGGTTVNIVDGRPMYDPIMVAVRAVNGSESTVQDNMSYVVQSKALYTCARFLRSYLACSNYCYYTPSKPACICAGAVRLELPSLKIDSPSESP